MPHSPLILPIYFCIVFAENHEAANEQYIFSFFSSGSELRGLRQDVLHLRHWRHDKEEVKKKRVSDEQPIDFILSRNVCRFFFTCIFFSIREFSLSLEHSLLRSPHWIGVFHDVV